MYFGPKLKTLGKDGKHRSKIAPEVADGSHGDLGRGREGKNCLEGEGKLPIKLSYQSGQNADITQNIVLEMFQMKQ